MLSENTLKVNLVDDFDDFYSPDSPDLNRANVPVHLENPNYELREIDICDAENLRQIFAENDFCSIAHFDARKEISSP